MNTSTDGSHAATQLSHVRHLVAVPVLIVCWCLALLTPLSCWAGKRTFLVEIGGQEVRIPDVESTYDGAVPSVLHVKEKAAFELTISGVEVVAYWIDPSTSEARGLLFLREAAGSLKLVGFEQAAIGDSLQTVFIFDADRDGAPEVVSLWGDEDSYEVAVQKLLVRGGEVQVESAFTSKRLLNPHYDADLPLYCVSGKALYFLYRYQDASMHKKAQLVFSEGDPTRELYLKPIGLVAEKEWAECDGG